MKNKVMKRLESLEYELKSVTKDLRAIEDSWPDHFTDDPDDRYQRNMFALIEDRLSDVRRDIQGLFVPVVAEGRLIKNSSGRYEIEGTDYEFTSGRGIEVLYTYYDDEPKVWIKSTVEHNGADYYLTNLTGVSMEGLRARVKRYPWD